MKEIPDILGASRIVPVVVINDSTRAPDLVDALSDGGIRCAEITLRTPAGLDAIRAASSHPDMVIGAGTVLTVTQVDAAADAGARFLVSPGVDDAVIARAVAHGIPIVPGVATATEVQRAVGHGIHHLKLFPAGLLGGLNAIHAFAGPFPQVRFMPSGGVTLDNARDYLADTTVFAISGSWMVPSAAVDKGDFEAIRKLSALTTEATADMT